MPLTASNLPIVKLSATGNDFLLIDLRPALHQHLWRDEFGAEKPSHWAKLFCDRFDGMGADGFILLRDEPGADFAWDFYNSDGGRAEMCGNAARAVSLFEYSLSGKAKLKFKTLAGMVDAEIVSPEQIEVMLPPVTEFEWGQSSNSGLKFDYIKTGVPHAVVQVADTSERSKLRELAMQVKGTKRFAALGTNVTFVHASGAHKIDSVTFERGVEDFTRSCGTGAVAAAYSLLRGKENESVEVAVPGGTLFVIWKQGRPRLKGPAKIVANMHWMRSL